MTQKQLLKQEAQALVLSKNVKLPLSAATWVIAYLAKRGAGKSYDAAVQAEEMLKHGIPIVVIDGMGIWWGLRAGVDKNGKLDPKKHGFPIVVFGGEHADLPLIPEQASEIAKAVVESNISCVLDISNFSRGISRGIVTEFLDTLYQLNRVDRHVYMEETDMFAPQNPRPDESICLGSVDNFVRRGGNHNLGCTLITQRTAVLNKNVLTQADCLMILRTLAPQDKKAIQAWVQEATDEEEKKLKVWYDSLKSLKNGEAYVWHPEEPVINNVRTMFRKRETFHATREFIKSPEATKIRLMDVGEFVGKFKTVFKEAPAPVKPGSAEETKQLRLNVERTAKDNKALQEENARLKAERQGFIDKIESLSRQASIAAPIDNVFEHPLVQQRMKELSQRGRDLLMKIESEPGQDRERLGMFLHSSRDTVKAVIDEINHVFRGEVIIDDGGRPAKYSSQLKRMFLTDVGRKEIDEIRRLTELSNSRGGLILQLQTEKKELLNSQETLKQQLKTYSPPDVVNSLKQQLSATQEQLKNAPRAETVERLKQELITKTSELKAEAELLSRTQKERDYLAGKIANLKENVDTTTEGFQQLMAKHAEKPIEIPQVQPVTPEAPPKTEASPETETPTVVVTTQSPETADLLKTQAVIPVREMPVQEPSKSIADLDATATLTNFLRKFAGKCFPASQLRLVTGVAEVDIPRLLKDAEGVTFSDGKYSYSSPKGGK